jgi:hypothetical protein
MDIQYHFIREQVHNNLTKFQYIFIENMVANTFTNNLNKTKHEHCMNLDLKKFHNTNNKLIVNLRSKHIVWKTLNVKNIDP